MASSTVLTSVMNVTVRATPAVNSVSVTQVGCASGAVMESLTAMISVMKTDAVCRSHVIQLAHLIFCRRHSHHYRRRRRTTVTLLGNVVHG